MQSMHSSWMQYVTQDTGIIKNTQTTGARQFSPFLQFGIQGDRFTSRATPKNALDSVLGGGQPTAKTTARAAKHHASNAAVTQLAGHDSLRSIMAKEGWGITRDV